MDTLELLDARARLRLMLGLWPYVVPLVLVYWAESAAAACNPRAAACNPTLVYGAEHIRLTSQPASQPAHVAQQRLPRPPSCSPTLHPTLSPPRYAIQAGAWTAFALPPSELRDAAARQRAYELLNLCYQVGWGQG